MITNKLLDATRTGRLIFLWGVLCLVLALAATGCAPMQQWCDDNPRQCRVVVVGSIATACVVAAGLAVSQTRGASPRQIGPVAPTCTSNCNGSTT